ncbi:MAG: AAA family ATPase [Candidatus Sulfotelmatobacter sp.]
MRLKSLHVRNFRALEEIDVDFESSVSVIVGPNAIGKTTLLEAIRLVKAFVAPRTATETNQALLAIGAVANYNPQRLILEAIARDPSRRVDIRCHYQLSSEELKVLELAVPRIATDVVLKSTGQNVQNQSFSIAFLSSTPGKALFNKAEEDIRKRLDDIRSGKQECLLDLSLDPVSGRANSADPLGGIFFAFLDSQNNPNETLFSYFPADRALPSGEQPVQLGGADAAQQIESHAAQPQLKYARLKNTIYSAMLTSELERQEIKKEFARIFGGILKGRQLVEVGINKYGLLSIMVQDTETNRIFSIDGMSSGEKGLLLTFLLIGRSVVDGGIILFDEPELHLNPAVCKDLLAFLVDNYVLRKNLQAIICSHSPEVLAGAFDKDECSLYHLVSEKVLSKVRYKDEQEISDALRRLGTSESEGLLYKATLFVEGEDDVILLEVGFGDILRRYKVKDLGGRREVEKQIIQLQAAERSGTKLSSRYFIFDLDEIPTGLKDSEAVKVLQWDRRNLENYLIDIDVLTDLLKDPDIVRTPLANQGEVSKLLRELAMSQISEFTARQVYATYQFDDPGLRASDLRGKASGEIADVLFARISSVQKQVCSLVESTWKEKFLGSCEVLRPDTTAIWEARWIEVCDGKRLFAELFQRIQFKISLPRFKRRIMLEMRSRRTANWRSIESLLKRLVET